MPRYKDYSYEQTKLVAVCFDRQIQEGSFEYALDYIVDNELDLSVFDSKYRNDETGAPAYDPAIVLKIVLYAYSRGIVHSRQIARACEENVVFMALSADTRPHFTTIADFISSMRDQIVPLFRDVVTLCYAEGLIGGQMFAVDGCKLSSNCSKEWSGTRAQLEKKAKKIEGWIRYLVEKHRAGDEHELEEEQRKKEKRSVENMKNRLMRLRGWLKENREDKRGSRGKALKQSNVTDNESAKMPTSHGVVQGYTGVATVDAKHQVVVQAEAFGENQEKQLLAPALDGMRENLVAGGMAEKRLKKAVIVADTGYHSEKNVEMVMEGNIDAIIADTQFRKRDPRFVDAGRHRKSVDSNKSRYTRKRFNSPDFHHDKRRNVLVCPAGKELVVIDESFRNTSGLIGTMYRARIEDCSVCAYSAKCRIGKSARTVTLFRGRAADAKETYTQKMIRKFDTVRGRYLYSRRLGIIEPVFGTIRNALGLDRFTLRGKTKVDIQWKLFNIVHNLRKIVRYSPRFA